jgi:hypothetical protein
VVGFGERDGRGQGGVVARAGGKKRGGLDALAVADADSRPSVVANFRMVERKFHELRKIHDIFWT